MFTSDFSFSITQIHTQTNTHTDKHTHMRFWQNHGAVRISMLMVANDICQHRREAWDLQGPTYDCQEHCGSFFEQEHFPQARATARA
jgi:hypothetical protein